MQFRLPVWMAIFAAALCWMLVPVPAWAGDANAARLLADKGEVLENRGAHDEALAALTEAIEMHALPAAEQARLLFARGVILDAQGKLADALGDYSGAIGLSPNFAPALNNRGNVYRRQDRPSDAAKDYQASLAAGNPQPEYPWYGLGAIAEARGDINAARQNYARAVAANPTYQLAATRLAALAGKDTPGNDQAIHLHAPDPRPKDSAVVLKSPPVRQAAPARPAVPAARVRSVPKESPGLRPGLDNSRSAGVEIQLGAWRTELEAGAGWNKAVRQADGLLEGLAPHIVAADLPGRGRYYRLRAGPVRGVPAQLCQALMARGLACVPVPD